MAGAKSDEESKDQQGGDGASHEHESCSFRPAARSRQRLGNAADVVPSGAGGRARSSDTTGVKDGQIRDKHQLTPCRTLRVLAGISFSSRPRAQHP